MNWLSCYLQVVFGLNRNLKPLTIALPSMYITLSKSFLGAVILSIVVSPVPQLQEKFQPHAIIPLPSKNLSLCIRDEIFLNDIGEFIFTPGQRTKPVIHSSFIKD